MKKSIHDDRLNRETQVYYKRKRVAHESIGAFVVEFNRLENVLSELINAIFDISDEQLGACLSACMQFEGKTNLVSTSYLAKFGKKLHDKNMRPILLLLKAYQERRNEIAHSRLVFSNLTKKPDYVAMKMRRGKGVEIKRASLLWTDLDWYRSSMNHTTVCLELLTDSIRMKIEHNLMELPKLDSTARSKWIALNAQRHIERKG